MQTTKDIAEIFVNALESKQFTKDKTGCKTIEMLGASFLADKPAIFGTPNQKYMVALQLPGNILQMNMAKSIRIMAILSLVKSFTINIIKL